MSIFSRQPPSQLPAQDGPKPQPKPPPKPYGDRVSVTTTLTGTIRLTLTDVVEAVLTCEPAGARRLAAMLVAAADLVDSTAFTTSPAKETPDG